MNQPAPFTIYNASAGSGKTFILAKNYLTTILTAPDVGAYKRLLAITFTNKAVAEMKQRIIDTLVEISDIQSVENPPVMLQMISEESGIALGVLQKKAQKVLQHLLHHYAQFSVETIDHFNHRLIRTFARDLKLPAHFEVSLDTPQLISEAVDNLIGKAGQDEQITEVLVAFALQKTEEDKSWDISYDIGNTASLLLNETDARHLQQFKELTLADFKKFETALRAQLDILEKDITAIGSEMLMMFAEKGIPLDVFPRETLPNHFKKLKQLDVTRLYDNTLGETLSNESTSLYKAKTNPEIAAAIDGLHATISEYFDKGREKVYTLLLLQNMLKNVIPLSVINLVQLELEQLKKQYNVLPISEFNSLIHEQIKDQPAPFIYERLGDRYRHFFIDEFQDTSYLQWQNLLPLVENALSQQFEDGAAGSLLLVGDAKQAIYRWRGGLPEQFMNLYEGNGSFAMVEKSIQNLDTNWRSCEAIISFNNAFFSFVSTYFGDAVHQRLYEIGNHQKTNAQPEGYVALEFIPPATAEEADELYGEKVMSILSNLTAQNYALDDICILTRTKKNGIALSTHLMEAGIAVVSSETLLLQFSPAVQCIINALTLSIFPENEQTKVSLLELLHDHFDISETRHDFLNKLLSVQHASFSTTLEGYGIPFSLKTIESSSLYEACEYIIRTFHLAEKSDAYLFAFMDLVLDFEQQPQAGKLNFLDYWDHKKEIASVPSGNRSNAVTVMTIHKSKGLEFPVVIFPYANTKLYHEINATAWFPIQHAIFDEMLISFKNEVEHYGESGRDMYQERRNTLELDNFNLLYVTLTRAVEQLYIISEMPKTSNIESPNDFNNTFTGFLTHQELWDPSQLVYTFGDFEKTCENHQTKDIANYGHVVAPQYLSASPDAHNLVVASAEAALWSTIAGAAIDFGNLLHDAMAQIKTEEDIPTVIERLKQRAILSSEKISMLEAVVRNIVTHPEVAHLYVNTLDTDTVFNERDILTKDHGILRPDRINLFGDNQVVLVDYKTGSLNHTHNAQVETYATALEEMGFSVREKILIYCLDGAISINKI